MNVAMAALECNRSEVEGPKRQALHPLSPTSTACPAKPPELDTTLRPDELILAVTLPPAKFAQNSYYLKARDRNSYAFALVSVAAGLEMAAKPSSPPASP